MTTNDPSILQVVLDEIRALRADMRIDISAIRTDMKANSESFDKDVEAAHTLAADAHKRIDRYENRFLGWLAAVGGGGAVIGSALSSDGFLSALKSLGKALSG